MCRLIVEKGADILHLDKSGKSPAEYAKRAKFTETYEYLNNEIKKFKEMNKVEEPGVRKYRSTKEEEIKGSKQTYKLVYYNDKGNTVELTQEEVAKLIEDKPELQQYLSNPETIPVDSWVETEADAWQRNAMKVIQQCLKSKGAYHFLEPVDPVKYNILDYFDIVTNPMDLGTAKKKLQHNCYASIKDFEQDMSLIW